MLEGDGPSARGAVERLLDRAVRAKVDAIRIDGAGAQLRRIQVHEPDGDRSDMIVTPDPP